MSPRQDLGDATRIPADLRAALAELRAGRRATLAEAGELVAERNALAVEARRGDPAAQERLGELNRRGVELAAKIDHFDADESALAERIGETLELQQRAVPGRPDAVAIAKALEGQFARADELMADLTTTFLACAALSRRFASTSKGPLRGLNGPARRQAAAHHHGLDRYFSMQPAPAHLRAPLSEIMHGSLQSALNPHPPWRPRPTVSATPPASVETSEEIPA